MLYQRSRGGDRFAGAGRARRNFRLLRMSGARGRAPPRARHCAHLRGASIRVQMPDNFLGALFISPSTAGIRAAPEHPFWSAEAIFVLPLIGGRVRGATESSRNCSSTTLAVIWPANRRSSAWAGQQSRPPEPRTGAIDSPTRASRRPACRPRSSPPRFARNTSRSGASCALRDSNCKTKRAPAVNRPSCRRPSPPCGTWRFPCGRMRVSPKTGPD